MHPFIASRMTGLSDRRGETRAHRRDSDHNSVSEYSRPAGVRLSPMPRPAAHMGASWNGIVLARANVARSRPFLFRGFSMASPSTTEKRNVFRRLHEAGCFVIPNPWNVGSARYLQGLGFKALATTSSGFAHAQGYADSGQSCDEVLAHFAEIAAATDVPVNADFEGGFADDPGRMAENVTRCIATGVAGLSIEDSTGDPDRPLYDFDVALARVKAARAAIDKAGGDVVFTARTEGFIRGRPDLDETCLL